MQRLWKTFRLLSKQNTGVEQHWYTATSQVTEVEVFVLTVFVCILSQSFVSSKNNTTNMDYQKVFTSLNQIITNPQEVQNYMANPQAYLVKQAIVNADEANMVIQLTVPLNEIMAYQRRVLAQSQEFEKVNNSYRHGITETNEQTIRGFAYTMLMYQVSFYLGIALLIAAVVFAIVTRESLYPILFGSIGTVDLLTFFITKPPLNLQQSRSHQAKLNAAFYSWFLDLYNWNSFYMQFSSKGREIDLHTMKESSAAQIQNTEKLMKIISEHIE